MRAGTSSIVQCANPAALESSFRDQQIGWTAIAAVCAPVPAAMAMSVALYVATLTIMLFRPPDVELYSVDRIAFAGWCSSCSCGHWPFGSESVLEAG